MKVLIFGAAGSIGRRHAENLLTLEPDARIIYIDPDYDWRQNKYPDWHVAMNQHTDAGAAIIASPTAAHLEQMQTLVTAGIPFYVEKPPCLVEEIDEYTRLVDMADKQGLRCAVGFQYRWHPNLHVVRWREKRIVRFYARDDLVARYGAACLEIMTSHPIDSALYAFGPAREVALHTDGFSVAGEMRHEHGGMSEFDVRLDEGPRVSYAIIDGEADQLDATNKMYRRALAGWLDWVQGGVRDPRTATLADGLAVMRVMAQVKNLDRQEA